MAALNDSPAKLIGLNWSDWADRLGLNASDSDSENEMELSAKRESASTRLQREDMSIYGWCPRWEDFYLVICNICGLSLKPQALKRHMEMRHGEEFLPNLKCSTEEYATSMARHKQTKARIRPPSAMSPVVKLERRIDCRDVLSVHSPCINESTMVLGSGTLTGGKKPILSSPSIVKFTESPMDSLDSSPDSPPSSPFSVSHIKVEVGGETLLKISPHPLLKQHGPEHSVRGINNRTLTRPIHPVSDGSLVSSGNVHHSPSVSAMLGSSIVRDVTTTRIPHNGSSLNGLSMSGHVSAEEQVKRISAMLQQEAEALSSHHGGRPGVLAHDVVEAHGLAGGGSGARSGGVTGSGGGLGGSMPVPVSHMSMATLNQIQADLLATVSESDLNAVLNATPDSDVIESLLLPTGGAATYLTGSDGMVASFLNDPDYMSRLPTTSSRSLHLGLYRSDHSEIASNDISRVSFSDNVSMGPLSSSGPTFTHGGESYMDTFSLVDDMERMQCDELTNAVRSITEISSQSRDDGCGISSADIDSPTDLYATVQRTPTPVASPNVSLPPLLPPLIAGTPLGITSSTLAAQGITVVIGGGHRMTINPQPVGVMGVRKISTPDGGLISPGGPLASPHTPSYHTTTSNQLSGSCLTPPPLHSSTPSPRKSNKKRKVGERKLVPLKDREYDAEVHCGVLFESGLPCTRSLTCKTHSVSLRRAVQGRSKKFDELLLEHRSAKEALTRATRSLSDSGDSVPQVSSCRIPSVGSSSTSGAMVGGVLSGLAATSPILVRTLGGGDIFTHGPPISYRMEPPATPTPTPPSPAPSYRGSLFSTPQSQAPPALTPSDSFLVRNPPKPLSSCTYNSRRMGGYLASDHRHDLLRSALRAALRNKPVTPAPSLEQLANVGMNSCILTAPIPSDRFVNVKPLLARKLQLTIPPGGCSSTTVGYNGHIQLGTGGDGVGTMNTGSVLANALKRPVQPVGGGGGTISPKGANGGSKKGKKCSVKCGVIEGGEGGIVMGGIKNHHMPYVAVSLPLNGLTPNTPTFTFGGVALAGGANRNSPQPIRLSPGPPTPVYVRDMQNVAMNPSLETSTGHGGSGGCIPDGAGFVLGGPGLGPGRGIVISDALAKSFKSDGAGGIQLELHSSAYAGPSRLVPGMAKVGGGSGTLLNAGVNLTTGVSGTPLGTGQVAYLTSGRPGVAGTPLTFQQVQQVINHLQQQQGKATVGGLKLLGPAPAGVTGNRTSYVLQQESEPS